MIHDGGFSLSESPKPRPGDRGETLHLCEALGPLGQPSNFRDVEGKMGGTKQGHPVRQMHLYSMNIHNIHNETTCE